MPLVDENPMMAEVIEVSLYGRTLKERDQERDKERDIFVKHEFIRKNILKFHELGVDNAIIANAHNVSVRFVGKVIREASILKLYKEGGTPSQIAKTMKLKLERVKKVIYTSEIQKMYFERHKAASIAKTLKIKQEMVEKVIQGIKKKK